MKVRQNEAGTLCIELGSQAEIDAMWLLAGHVGGDFTTLRRFFSNVMGEEPGLFELLDPYVSPLLQTGSEPGGIPRQRAIAAVAGLNYEQTIQGHLCFKPLTGESFDEQSALQSMQLSDSYERLSEMPE